MADNGIQDPGSADEGKQVLAATHGPKDTAAKLAHRAGMAALHMAPTGLTPADSPTQVPKVLEDFSSVSVFGKVTRPLQLYQPPYRAAEYISRSWL